MLRVPAARLDVVHAAVRELPLPLSATAEQPEIAVPPSLKSTLPVGALPVTVAVNVTLAPAAAGLAELARPVVVLATATTCDSALLVDAALLALPPYVAVRLWVPMARLDVEHTAVRELPLPVNATAEQPEIDAPPSLKSMLPVGALPVTVAVSVTLAPATAGLAELTRPVVVLATATTCDSALLVDAALLALPP
jgi:hypothetical protein